MVAIVNKLGQEEIAEHNLNCLVGTTWVHTAHICSNFSHFYSHTRYHPPNFFILPHIISWLGTIKLPNIFKDAKQNTFLQKNMVSYKKELTLFLFPMDVIKMSNIYHLMFIYSKKKMSRWQMFLFRHGLFRRNVLFLILNITDWDDPACKLTYSRRPLFRTRKGPKGLFELANVRINRS